MLIEYGIKKNMWRKIVCLVGNTRRRIRKREEEKDKPIPLGLLMQTKKKHRMKK